MASNLKRLGYSFALALVTGPIHLGIPAQASDANDRGWQINATCAACHRLDGRSSGIPPIAGLSEDQLTRAMRAYSSGERPSQIMRAVALSLSDEDIASVARFVAAQGKKAAPP